MEFDKIFDEIQMKVAVDLIDYRQKKFEEYLGESEEDNFAYPNIANAIICHQKANEEDDPEPVVVKGTRNHNKAFRYDMDKKAKADAIKKAYYSLKGGYTPIYRGENGETKVNAISTSEWLSEGEKAFWKHVKAAKKTGNRQRFDWKKASSKKYRHEGKGVCRDYTEDKTILEREYQYDIDIEKGHIEEDDFDPVCNPWGYTEEEKSELNYLHGDFSDAYLDSVINGEDCDEDDYEYLLRDPYQAACDNLEEAWEEISELKKEIATYKDFLGEFNLNKLFEHWLADNNS